MKQREKTRFGRKKQREMTRQLLASKGIEMPEPQQPFRRIEAKQGRNNPCKCGSNLKYKKCCGRTGEQIEV